MSQSVLRGLWAIVLSISTFTFFASHGCAAPAPTANDSVRRPEYVARNIQYGNKYTFIDYTQNNVNVGDGALINFFSALKSADTRKVKVLHIGDSHVQADIVTGALRNRLQQVFGAGGRGFVFPYAAANTHPGYDYLTYSRGKWDYARNVHQCPVVELGTTGVSIRTNDSKAGFKLVFNKFYYDANNTVVKIYCKKSVKSFDLRIRYNEKNDTIRVSCRDSLTPYVKVILPVSPQTLDISVVKDEYFPQNFFECYGVSLETVDNKGILYHSVGINGATLEGVCRQTRMEQELVEMRPDLVIVDLGANEYYSAGLNKDDYESHLRQVVEKIRKSAPSASILLVPSQDIYRGVYYNLADCQPAAELTRKVAEKMNVGFYDYYKVSGGRYSMLKWRANNLAKSDRVHLTFAGYIAKGELVANALMNAYFQYLTQDTQMPTPVFAHVGVTRPAIASYAPEYGLSSDSPKNGVKYEYTVRPGDNLGRIASQYGVSVASLIEWNGLPSTFIRVGDKLSVYSARTAATAANTYVPPKTTPKLPAAIPTPTKSLPIRTHTVQSGETLWAIARKYGVTVDAIRKANGVYSNLIKPGMKFIIK